MRRAPRARSTCVNPPVEAPTSRQTRSATATPKHASAPSSLTPPRDTHGKAGSAASAASTAIASDALRTGTVSAVTRPAAIAAWALARLSNKPRSTSRTSARWRGGKAARVFIGDLMLWFTYSPHPEERALARVSKDGHRHERCRFGVLLIVKVLAVSVGFGHRAPIVWCQEIRQRMSIGAYLYILRCADGRYYVGTTRKSLDERLGEHNAGLHAGFTATRRPVTMVFAQHFETIVDAVAAERQVKGWSRAKKEAMINGEWNRLPELVRRHSPHSTRRFP